MSERFDHIPQQKNAQPPNMEARFELASPSARRLWELVARYADMKPTDLVDGFDWDAGKRAIIDQCIPDHMPQTSISQTIAGLIPDEELRDLFLEKAVLTGQTVSEESISLSHDICHRKVAHLIDMLTQRGIKGVSEGIWSWFELLRVSLHNPQVASEHAKNFRKAFAALSEEDRRQLKPYLRSLCHLASPSHLLSSSV